MIKRGIRIRIRGRHAQTFLGMSFKMIFSIILIIIFIVFSFYAISKFLESQRRIEINLFINDVQNIVENFRNSEQGKDTYTFKLPVKINYVCFADTEMPATIKPEIYQEIALYAYGETSNLFFYPFETSEGVFSTKINYIALDEIIKDENPYCIENKEGQVAIIFEKTFSSPLVKIKRG